MVDAWQEDREFAVCRDDDVTIEAGSEEEAIRLCDASPSPERWRVVSRQVERGPWEDW